MLYILRPAEADKVTSAQATHQHDVPAGSLEVDRRWRCGLHQADNANHRRRKDRVAQGFVVETNVAAGDGGLEERTRLAHPFDGLHQLRHNLRTLRITEVEVVRSRHRQCAYGGQVPAAFRYD